MSTSVDQLEDVDLSKAFGRTSNNEERKNRLAATKLDPPARGRRRPAGTDAPAVETPAETEATSTSARDAPPAPQQHRTSTSRRSRKSEPDRGRGKTAAAQAPAVWETQTINNATVAMLAKLNDVATLHDEARAEIVSRAVRTHLDAAIRAFGPREKGDRKPAIPHLPGDQTPTRITVRLRGTERESVRTKVEAKLTYRGALTDVYRWCLATYLSSDASS